MSELSSANTKINNLSTQISSVNTNLTNLTNRLNTLVNNYGRINAIPAKPMDLLGNGFTVRTVEGNPSNAPTSNNPCHWTILTFGYNLRVSQLAFYGFIGHGLDYAVYYRMQHDGNVTAWRKIH